MKINRREFMIAAGSMLTATTKKGESVASKLAKDLLQGSKTKISLIKTSDRESGIKRAIDILKTNPVRSKDVLLKPNFNSADTFPGSTHNDTLINLILVLKKMGAKSIVIGERSGPAKTAKVLKEKGIYDICRIFDVGLINFDELPPAGWVRIKPDKSHWSNGFEIARPVIDSKCIITTCCLKTHSFGGVFTMALKLSVGTVNKKNMKELHGSPLNMRKMIAEVNKAYNPALIILDGIEAFVDGGPATGVKQRADVILAGTDRIAIDAAGLAILKELGSNQDIMGKKIFEQEQISRAVELGLGITKPSDIELLTDSEEGSNYAKKIMEILLEG